MSNLRDISEQRNVYLFGFPIAHSLSPLLHSSMWAELGVPWRFSLIESTDKANFLPMLQAEDCVGSAVTMPHKVTFMSEVDEVTEEARIIGAINTVFISNDSAGKRRYIGTNTDCEGVTKALTENVPHIKEKTEGRPAMVIGAGGACRSAVYALWKYLGASKVYLVNRISEEVEDLVLSFRTSGFEGEVIHVDSVEMAKKLETPVVAVGCVPDFSPSTAGEHNVRNIVLHFLRRPREGESVMLEMCYHPRIVTELYKLSEEAGWIVIPGTEAMIYQGIAQEILWTGIPLDQQPVEKVKAVIKSTVERTQAINDLLPSKR